MAGQSFSCARASRIKSLTFHTRSPTDLVLSVQEQQSKSTQKYQYLYSKCICFNNFCQMGYVPDARLWDLVPHENKIGARSIKSILKFRVLGLQCFLGFFICPIPKIEEKKSTAQQWKASVSALVFQYNRALNCSSKTQIWRWPEFLRGWSKNALSDLPTLYSHPPEKHAITDFLWNCPQCSLYFFYLALSNKYVIRCAY